MDLSQKDFQILDAIDRKKITTQRQLSQQTGISLGQTNYVLRRLMDKGLVSVRNFHKGPRRIGYAYGVTSKGLEAKSKLAVNFVTSSIEEYNRLRRRLTKRLNDLEQEESLKVLFVGPAVVKDFVESIIRDKALNLVLCEHHRHVKDLDKADPDSFDVALLFDEDIAALKKEDRFKELYKEKLVPLWQ
jgi:EPS-associated MarR family transcriptional regulator